MRITAHALLSWPPVLVVLPPLLLWPPLVLHVCPLVLHIRLPLANVHAHHSFTLALICTRSHSCLCGRTRLCLFMRAVVFLLVPATWCLCSCLLGLVWAHFAFVC